MKKFGIIIFILICFLVFGNLVFGANLIDNVDSGIQKIEDTKNKIDSVVDGSTKWDYLGKEWKTIFLKNKIISVIDSSLTKTSIVFDVLLGENYNFSLAFFFMILVWFYLLFNLSYLLKVFFSNGISWAISFLILLIFARVHLFAQITSWTGKLFILLGEFISILPLLILVFIVVIWLLFYYFENTMRMFTTWYLKKMRRLRDQQRKVDETLLHTTVQGLMNALTRKK
ncbi:MAG: hypothetical protein WC584_03035 [Candidatus Pacearchaeota archaeon]